MSLIPKTHAVKVTKDVPYGTGHIHVSTVPKVRTLALDIYAPESAPSGAPRPALIMAFGGAFHRGTKETDEFGGDGQHNTPVSAYCHEFARRGYVAFSIDYRLVQEDPDAGDTPVVLEPANIPRSRVDVVRELLGLPPATQAMLHAGIEAASDDMVKAFRFVESGAARFGVDPARIAIGGFSAGARTALNAAYAERIPVAAVISLSGYMSGEDLGRHVTGAAWEPPAFTVTGENDLDYVARQASTIDRHFSAVGLLHESWVVPGGTHFYPASSEIVAADGRRSRLEDGMAEFLYRTLGTAGL